jgi:hypothetical protein
MGNIYIDPDYTGGGNDGSFTNPWTSFPSFASNNNYYIKRGATIHSATRPAIFNLSNVLIGAYYDNDGSAAHDSNTNLPRPILTSYKSTTNTGDFAETSPGSNEWVLVSGSDKCVLLGLGSLGDRHTSSWTERVEDSWGGDGDADNTFDTFGQWTYKNAIPDQLVIYSEDNPVTDYTEVFYGGSTGPDASDGFRIVASTGNISNITVENIHFMHDFHGLKLYVNAYSGDNVIIRNNIFEHCYTGVWLYQDSPGYVTNCQVINNEFYECGNVSIRMGEGLPGLYIAGNKIYNTGGCEGIGAIYGKAGKNVDTGAIIEYNLVDGVYDTKSYWTGENHGYYLESESTNNIIRHNIAINVAEAGIHVNAGETNNLVYNNIVLNGSVGLSSNDAKPVNNTGVKFYNNTCVNVDTGMIINRINTLDVGLLTVKNNIFLLNSGSTSAINFNANADDVTGLVDEDYNIAFNCTNYMTRAGSPSGLQNSIGANSQIIDPKLDSQYTLKTDSPCIGTGTATVSERDYSGRYRKSLTYDIGAKWFNAHEDSTINTLLASGGSL